MGIEQQLELARRELLEMGLRSNPLLSLRIGARSLEVFDELSVEVYRLLVDENKRMTFLPVPEPFQEENDRSGEEGEEEGPEELPPLAEYLSQVKGGGRHTDQYLQTKLLPAKLDTVLLKIENEAHTLLQEQGIEVLYLALGMLQWYESESSNRVRRAPLVLLPVELQRSSSRDTFGLAYTGEELGPNLTLAAKLKGEFKIVLPEFNEEFDISSYFAAVAEAVAGKPRWKVAPDSIALGLFSFGKFQMYMDLDHSRWPADKSPIVNPLLNRLFDGGFEEDAGRIEDIENHESIDISGQLNLVKDSDSSQTKAVLAVMAGGNLVIQGPPGTGKSQTITNIIAEAVGAGKKVLFVAQKIAALSVVKQRLDECHLGHAVLELHSHKSTKKAVHESIKATFEQGRPSVPQRSREHRRLKELRQSLNEYVVSTGSGILGSEVTYIEALGKLLRLKSELGEERVPELPFERMSAWGSDELVKALRVAADLAEHLAEMEPVARNPFSMSSRRELSPTDQNLIAQKIPQTRSILKEVAAQAQTLSEEMGLPSPTTLAEVGVVHRAAARAAAAPHIHGVRLNTDDWQVHRTPIREALLAGAEVRRVRELHVDRFLDAAFSGDLLKIRQGLAGRTDKWWRFLSGDYRRGKAGVRGLMKADLEGKPGDWLAWVDDLLECQRQEKVLAETTPLCETLFGAQWQGKASDWEVLSTISEWLIALYEEIGKGEVPEGVISFLEGEPSLLNWEERLADLESVGDQAGGALLGLVGLVEVPEGSEYADAKSRSLEFWFRTLEGWSDSAAMYQFVRYNQLCDQLVELNLQDVADLSREWAGSPSLIPAMIEQGFYSGLVNHAYAQHTAIKNFDRIGHERAIAEFRELDESVFGFAQERLVTSLYESLPSLNAAGEMDTIRREMNKKRRHIPIRRLIEEAGTAIQQIKPIFMMSPMSVATYLKQGAIEFDLVIFDEASQVVAPDALGSIMRGKQVVVVGDSKQMPPTNFFSKAVELDDEEAEESATADIESILGLLLAKGVPEVMLQWHYRSRHDSLIAVSNDQFYNNKLMVFPSSGAQTHATGLRLRHFPETHYDRGGTRANKGEARHVAEAVIEHARTKPQLSLGVVCFSMAQRDLVLLEVERLRRENPEVDSFFVHHEGSDEFFVKNLESVQGDERDAIFISVGYGRTAAGKMPSSFGPVNNVGGERRLNVLISRARMAMEVFSNFTADDVRTDDSSPFGVRAFKAFLKYAETGELEVPRETGREADSLFEVEVGRAISALGHTVVPQVGSQGFYIDLAVADPEKAGRYILAVECDGATYHSSASARDRDRIRQGVLEGLGWRFHRVWSTDWFRNPEREIERVRDAIELAQNYYSQLDMQSEPEGANAPVRTGAGGAEIDRGRDGPEGEIGIDAYRLASTGEIKLPSVDDFDQLGKRRLRSGIEAVVGIEGPIHLQVLTGRLTTAAGFTRSGSRIKKRVEQEVQDMVRAGTVEKRGDFIFAANQDKVPLRNWSELEAAQRRVEFVADEEFAQAIFLTVKDAFSVGVEDCTAAALNLIGFMRVTAGFKSRIERIIAEMVAKGTLVESGSRLRVASE